MADTHVSIGRLCEKAENNGGANKPKATKRIEADVDAQMSIAELCADVGAAAKGEAVLGLSMNARRFCST